MNVYVSERNTGANRAHGEIKPKVLIIDEAGSVDRDIVISLLERARSANISVVLSTQSPSSWKTGRTDDWSRITNNTNVAIIMRQANPDEAEICADYIGKSEQYSVSQKVTEGELADGGSARLSYEHHVAPEQIRDLVTGEAILRSGTTRRVEYVKVMMRNPRD
jgi:type IV secretory pathway TraG/TraD family ATPase VirD4